MRQPVYELEARRVIIRDGMPILTLARIKNEGRFNLTPSEADELAVHIVSLLNFDSQDSARG